MTRPVTQRTLLGTLAALASMAILVALMLPVRSNISIATAALVLVVPVVVGVVTGGFVAGLLSVIAGFLTYLFLFIPPYLTTDIGAAENWTALAVYGAITIPIARVVDMMIKARAQADERGRRLRQLLEVSGLLVEDKPQGELLTTIVTALRDVVDARQVSILLPHDNRLEIFASAGAPLTDEDRRNAQIAPSQLATLDDQKIPPGDSFALPLMAAGRPVGLLAISGATITERQREPLRLFASQAAVAIERAQLREETIRAERRLERGLLPMPLITDDGGLTVVSRYQPGREHAQLGGDFFDVVRTGDGRVWVMIGDVAGHGPDEAVLGVYLRVGWRALVLAGHAPAKIMPALEQLLINERHHEETFATACMLVIDERAGGATVFLAGHPAPLFICDERIDEIDLVPDPPLGVIPDARWTGQRAEFDHQAWSLLCFTDGLIEGFDAAPPARLGVEGLIKLLSVHPPDADANDLVDTLIADVIARNGGALADDVALVHLRRGR